MKIAYITSSPYSGSTLLSFILNAHPRIATISEYDVMDDIKKNPDYLCSCGKKIRQCDFFLQLKERMEGSGFSFELDDMDMMYVLHSEERINRYLSQKLPIFNSSAIEDIRDAFVGLVPKYRHLKETFFERNNTFMKTILELQGGDVFLDANKNPYRMKLLSQRYDVRAIYLYKNGIAGVYSFLKVARRLKRPLSVEDAANRWFVEQLTINRCLESIDKEKVVRVAYSDLCQHPEDEIGRICGLLDVETAPIDGFQDATHHIVGNAMRIKGVEEIKERLDWQDNLTEQDFTDYRRVLNKYEKKLAMMDPVIVEKLWR